jgi:hypothetical protein
MTRILRRIFRSTRDVITLQIVVPKNRGEPSRLAVSEGESPRCHADDDVEVRLRLTANVRVPNPAQTSTRLLRSDVERT